MDNLDFTTRINFNEILNIDNGFSLFFYGLWNNGQKATDLMGDFQVASNIESVESVRIFEFWLQRNFFNDRISFLLGLYDLNSEFDVIRPATMFINSSFGIGAEYAQSGQNGPSIFPISSFGLRLSTFLGNRTRLKIAVLDAVPGDPTNLKLNNINLSKSEGALIAAEATYYTGESFGKKQREIDRDYETRRRKVGREFGVYKNDRIKFGSWVYTSEFPEIDNEDILGRGNFGVYLSYQKYFSIGKEDDYLTFFARVGLANSRFNRIGLAISGGSTLSNPFTDYDDSFGLGFTTAINGIEFMRTGDYNRTETALELTYSLPLYDWLLIQPDLQYIINPSTELNIDNPISIAVMIQFSLGN